MSKKSFLFILTVLLSFSLTGCTVVGDMVDAYKKASRSFYFNDNVAPTLRYIDQEDKEKKEEEELNPAMKRYLEIGKNKTYYPAVNVSGLSIDKNADLGQFSFDHDIIYKGEKVKNYKRDESISFPKAQDYSFIEGITAFRGNHYRNTASYGVADIKSGKLEQIWEVSIGYIDTWTGVGWTGQPVIVKWPESTKLAMNLYSDKR